MVKVFLCGLLSLLSTAVVCPWRCKSGFF